MDRSQVDGILSSLVGGEDPQAQVSQIYAMAIDAVAQTFQETLCALCDAWADHMGAESILEDNPLGAWLKKFLPHSPTDMAALKRDICEKMERSKAALAKSLQDQSLSMKNVPLARGGIPPVQRRTKPLPKNRLEEIYRNIQHEKDDRTHYRISLTPTSYRFSLSGREKPPVRRTAETEVCQDAGACKSAYGIPKRSIALPVKSPDDGQAQLKNTPIAEKKAPLDSVARGCANGREPAGLENVREWASEMGAPSSDMMEAMQAIALQIADVIVSQYDRETGTLPLSERLCDDPRVEDTAGLALFIRELDEAAQGEPEIGGDAVGNDELAMALEKLLESGDLP